MKPSKIRRGVKMACVSVGVVSMLIGAATEVGGNVNLGGGIVVWVAQGTLRIESHWQPGGWRGHPFEVRWNRQRPAGAALEIGGGLLAVAGAVVALAPFCVPRRRERVGACAACGYDRRGLAADAACPECGGIPALTTPLSA